MAYPQPGLFVQGVTVHRHLELTLRPGASANDLRAAVAQAREDSSWLNGPNITWGFSPAVWATLAPDDVPPDAQVFEGVVGASGMTAPATQWDIWVWCSGNSEDFVVNAADQIHAALGAVADTQLILPGYTTPDSRDPTGFIDGTENPKLDEAQRVTLYPDGSPGAGGTSALIQKWVHKLAEFDALPLSEQEDVIGRTKSDSVQLADDVMPSSSHVARNTVLDDEGEERHIYRRNTPFNTGDQTGTQFIGLTNDTELMMEMLRRMFAATGDGRHDRLVEFSDATTGSWYFVPSMTMMTTVFGEIAGEEDDDDQADSRTADTSLKIGSLLQRPDNDLPGEGS